MKKSILAFLLVLVLPNAVILLLIDRCGADSAPVETATVIKKEYQEGYWHDAGYWVTTGNDGSGFWVSDMQYQDPQYKVKVKLPNGKTKFGVCPVSEGEGYERGSKIPVVRKSGMLFGTDYGYTFEQ